MKSEADAGAYTRSNVTWTSISSEEADAEQDFGSVRPHAFEQEPHTYSVVAPSYTLL